MPCSVNLNLSELRDGWEVTKGKQLGARKISAVGVSLSWALFWSCTTVAKPGRQKAPLPGLDWDRFCFVFFFRMPVLHGAVSTIGHQGLLWLSGLKVLETLTSLWSYLPILECHGACL